MLQMMELLQRTRISDCGGGVIWGRPGHHERRTSGPQRVMHVGRRRVMVRRRWLRRKQVRRRGILSRQVVTGRQTNVGDRGPGVMAVVRRQGLPGQLLGVLRTVSGLELPRLLGDCRMLLGLQLMALLVLLVMRCVGGAGGNRRRRRWQ